jgi:DNA replication and repair protein RecF
LKLQRVALDNFRNHSSTHIECSLGVNLFLGNNGEGKTNILEGISYFCLAKSFYAANDSHVTKFNEQGFVATGRILSDSGIEYEVRVEFIKEINQKNITVNKSKIEKASSLIGQFPVVILSPEQGMVTFGSPADRRRFVDFVLSQSNRIYLENLIDYRRILKQRNRILSETQSLRQSSQDPIEPWNDSLIKAGSSIIRKRIEFVHEFQSIMTSMYAQICGIQEQPNILYAPSFEFSETQEGAIEDQYKQVLENQFADERRIGYTLAGPHRDEFIFQINECNIKNYASQGQHKTFLVSLKLAEFYYLKNRCNETPFMLLDDVLSELDRQRSQRLIEAASNAGQVFITSTDEYALEGLSFSSSHPRKFFVRQGKIERVEDTATIH